MTKNITMVVAAYRLEKSEMLAFIDRNRENFVKHNINVIMVVDREIELDTDWVSPIIFPRALKRYCPGKTTNYGIRNAQCEDDDIIIKTDIDVYFSSDILSYIKDNVSYKNAMLCYSLFCNYSEAKIYEKTWEEACKRNKGKIVNTTPGICFAMTKKDWYDFKGHDERMIGYGHEDTELKLRVENKINLNINYKNPLFHINHPTRRTDKEKSKKEKGRYWSNNIKANKKISEKMDWNDENWGRGIF